MLKLRVSALVLLLSLFCASIYTDGNAETPDIGYACGELFSTSLYDVNGDAYMGADKPTFILYLSSGCGSCLALIENFSTVLEILGDAYVQPLFVWHEEIPIAHLEKHGIPMEINLVAKGSKLAPIWSTAFIVDVDGEILYISADVRDALSTLIATDFYPDGYLSKKASSYLLAHMSIPTGKIPLLYFYMSGCPDCLEADQALQNHPAMEEYFAISKLYRHDESATDRWNDHWGLLSSIYGVTWYPSFLVFNNSEPTLIGKTEVEMLCKQLIATIE